MFGSSFVEIDKVGMENISKSVKGNCSTAELVSEIRSDRKA